MAHLTRGRAAAALVAALVLVSAHGLAPAAADLARESAATGRAARGPLYVVSRTDTGYQAVSRSGRSVFHGSLKTVMEAAADAVEAKGGGVVRLTAGRFSFGRHFFLGRDIHNVAIVGAGMRKTLVRNYSNAARDTEPFNFQDAFGVRIRNLSVSAGGSPRLSSDALDFDRGHGVIVENVRVLRSRGRGIVFDGKDDGATAEGNRVTNCVVSRTAGDGIELLAASRNVIEGCRIFRVGGNGISVVKASASAAQPNKQSRRNVVRNNRIRGAGHHGILVLGSDSNRIVGNRVYNSSRLVDRRDGIRIAFVRPVSCDENLVAGNVAADVRRSKRQAYGLNIDGPGCRSNVIGTGNDFFGNLFGRVQDLGSGTIRR